MPSRFAAIDYPSDFPCFSKENYSMVVGMGLVRTGSEIALPNQRRSYNNLPTIITALFEMDVQKLYNWSIWVNNNLGLWVNFPMAHPFMPQGTKLEVVPARIISTHIQQTYIDFNMVVAALELQLAPSVFSESTLP